jgi:anti-anti-sigma factor
VADLTHDLEIEVAKVDGVSLLRLSGRFTIGDNADRLRETFATLYETGERHFLFNLKNVSHMDSTGLGELVACHRQLAEGGGALTLVAVPDKIVEVMKFTRVGINIRDSEEKALADDQR